MTRIERLVFGDRFFCPQQLNNHPPQNENKQQMKWIFC